MELKERLKEVFEDFAKRSLKAFEEGKEDEVEALEEELRERLKTMGLEVELYVECDASNYFNAPGWPRAYNYYSVSETHRVVAEKEKKAYLVTVVYDELQKPTETEFKFREVLIDELHLIGEDTPFSATLVQEIPWELVRPIWRYKIEQTVNRIIKAEREGRLNVALRDVVENLKASAWIHEYHGMLNAVYRAMKRHSITLED